MTWELGFNPLEKFSAKVINSFLSFSLIGHTWRLRKDPKFHIQIVADRIHVIVSGVVEEVDRGR